MKYKTWDYPYDLPTLEQVLYEVNERQDYKAGLDYINSLKHPATVIDLGAYVGITAKYFCTGNVDKIYAVEPHPDAYKSLVKNVGDKVIPVNNAIGFKHDKRYIHQHGELIGMSLYGSDSDEKIPVDVIPIDALFDKYKIEHCDLMKIDVESSEYEIFLSDGFKSVKSKIDFIIGEAHDSIIQFEVVKPLLEDCGFKVDFLPIDNMITDSEIMIAYHIYKTKLALQTLFVAKRI